MKLHNYTLSYLSVSLLGIITVWATIFYINMLDEVRDSIDDGLDNNKQLIIQRAAEDTSLLHKTEYLEGNYAIKPITVCRQEKDDYKDTVMYMANEEDYEPVRILTTCFTNNDGRHYSLRVFSSMVEEDDLEEDLFYALIWLYIAIVVSVVVINNFLLRKIWQPFYSVIRYLKEFKLKDEHRFAPVATNVTEFRDLNNTVQALLDETVAAYRNQKQFIENASHEIQTPLAISINKLELLAERNINDEAQLEMIADTLAGLERLTRLNKSLLLISKIENNQYADTGTVDINGLLNKMAEDFAELAEFKQGEINIVENSPLVWRMNKDLAGILVTNLLKNAVVHTVPGSSVDVVITNSGFSIANAGTAPLDAERIFKRFYKSGSNKQSTGLGLSIVKAIAVAYGISISYRYNNKHIFELHKPSER